MKRNIVFLTAITFPGQEYRSAPYKYGIDSWKHWCDKNNCDLFVLDEPIFDTEYCDHKYTVTNTEGSMDWVCRSLENYGKHIFEDTFPLHKYFNAGFQVVNKIHRPLFNELHEFYEVHRDRILWMQSNFAVGTDQPLINYIVNLSGMEMKFLHYQYCMADLARKEILDDEMTFTKVLKGIYQFNAIPDNEGAKKTMYCL